MRKKNRLKLVLLLLTTFILGCSYLENDKKTEKVIFDFSDTTSIDNQDIIKDHKNQIRIAVAAITSPRETFTFYKDMFKYIEMETGMPVLMIQRKTYEEINILLKQGDVDVAFICSGGYVFGHSESWFNLLVIPERMGKKNYQTYIIAHNSSTINSLKDLRGKSFAFTDPLSTSGYLYPTKRLRDMGYEPNTFFGSHTYTYAHDNSIQLVSKKIVDGASVNSLVFDYLNETNPDRVRNIKIIEKSEWYGIPPVVISNKTPDELKIQLEAIFLKMHLNPSSKKVLDKLMFDRFVNENDSIYNSVRRLLN